MIRVSHEVPISLLEESKVFNDYDYCLLHLTEIPEYRDYYINAIKEGRQVLLDNSLFELGDALTVDDVAKGVELINPTWVVVPDCLNDCDTTIARFEEWKAKYADLDVLTIGVAQGDNVVDLIRCYLYMAEHADKIAIPFDSKAFESVFPCEDKLTSWTKGRRSFIQLLVNQKIWSDKPHHLLGCSYAKEFEYYVRRNIDIDTVDTSNPVVAAIKGLEYGPHGLDTKPSVKLCDLINYNLTDEQKTLVYKNTNVFKDICGRKAWVAFFSQTGGEISNISEELGRWPDLIITNRANFEGVDARILKSGAPIIQLPDRPTVEEYMDALKSVNLDTALITLHGYLRIIPPEICKYNVVNLHPGLITKYPELKGFNPQEKAVKMGLKSSGVVIHKVVPEVDSGEIILAKELMIANLTLDEVYESLHDLATEAWCEIITGLM